MNGTNLVVNRWRRWGMDRLYVEQSSRVKVGWWDLQTDQPHPESPDDLPILASAFERWQAEKAGGSGMPAPVSDPEPSVPRVPAQSTFSAWSDEAGAWRGCPDNRGYSHGAG